MKSKHTHKRRLLCAAVSLALVPVAQQSIAQDDSIEEVYASHVLEHVRQIDVENVLKGIQRILKKNGTIT